MTSSLMVYRRKKKPQASAVVLRKYRRLRRRRGGLRCEYKKLKALLPETTKAARLKKVGVVEAAYRYICQLQDALLDKFSSKGVPEDLAGVVCGKVTSSSDIQALALHLIRTSGSDFPLPPSWLPPGFNGTPFGSRDPDSTSSSVPQRQLSSSKSSFITGTSPSASTSSAFSPSSSSSTSSQSSSPLASPIQSAPANSPSHFFSFTTSNSSSTSSSISPASSSSSPSSSNYSHTSFASQETGSSRSASIPPRVPMSSSSSSSFQTPAHTLPKDSLPAIPAQPRETTW